MDILNITSGINDTPLAQEMEDLLLARGSSVRAKVLAMQPSGEATLRIGSQVIKAILNQYVEPGRDLQAIVLETSPRLLLMPSPPRTDQLPTAPSNPEAISRTAEFNQTTPAPTWVGRLISTPGHGQVQLLIIQAPPHQAHPLTVIQSGAAVPLKPGQTITARLSPNQSVTTLDTGQDIRFSITETSPQLVLDIISQKPPPRPAYMPNLVNYLGNSSSIIDTLTQWSQTFRDLPDIMPHSLRTIAATMENLVQELSPEAGSVDKQFLGRLINLLGLNGGRSPLQEQLARFLSQLHREDLKSDPDTLATWRHLLDTTARLYEAIENVQLLNQETARLDQSLLAAFPLCWLDQRGQGEILVRRDDSSAPGRHERSYRISLLLSLSALGRLKVDVELTKKNIRGTVWTEPGAPHEAVSGRLGSLSESLEAAGLKVNQLNAQVFPQAIPIPESLAVQLLPDREGLIDVKV